LNYYTCYDLIIFAFYYYVLCVLYKGMFCEADDPLHEITVLWYM